MYVQTQLSNLSKKGRSLPSSVIHPRIVPSGMPNSRFICAFETPLFTRSITLSFYLMVYDFLLLMFAIIH
jgi:hypothetical protein